MSNADSAGAADGQPRDDLLDAALTIVVCGLGCPLLIVLVGGHGWPAWWLVVAGALLAWTGDAVWTLGIHLASRFRVRRAARRWTQHQPGAARATPWPPAEPGDRR